MYLVSFLQISPSKKQHKSLFAQQFMKSSPTSFGIPDFRIKATSTTFEHNICEENMEVNVELSQSKNGKKKFTGNLQNFLLHL